MCSRSPPTLECSLKYSCRKNRTQWSYKHKIILHILAWLEFPRKALLWKSLKDYTLLIVQIHEKLFVSLEKIPWPAAKSAHSVWTVSVWISTCRPHSESKQRGQHLTTSWGLLEHSSPVMGTLQCLLVHNKTTFLFLYIPSRLYLIQSWPTFL